MQAILAIALKDIRLLAADKIGAFFVFGWPLLYAIFFGVVIGGMFGGGDDGAKPLEVLVVDQDQTEQSQDFAAQLDDAEALKVEFAEDEAAAESLVRQGKRAGYVRIPAGFGVAARNIFAGEAMKVDVVVDPSRRIEAAMIEGLVNATAFRQLQSVFTDRGRMLETVRANREDIAEAEDLSPLQRRLLDTLLGSTEQFLTQFDRAGQPVDDTDAEGEPTTQAASQLDWQPVKVTVRSLAPVEPAAQASTAESDAESDRDSGRGKLTTFAIVFPQGIAWGIMACAATFGLTLVIERTQGTLPRLTVAPITRAQILAGKALACFLTTAVLCTVLLIIARYGFSVVPASVPLLALGVFCVSVAVVGIMMLFSVLGKTEASASGAAWAIVVIMAMFGGGMLPLFQLRGWMETLSYISVFRWSILALEGAIWRGFNLPEMMLPCGILLTIGVVGFVGGTAVFRWRN